MTQQIMGTTENKAETSTLEKLADIQMVLSWREVARDYFGKSSSWIYNKLEGTGENGETNRFTSDEQRQLREALYDLSNRIRRAADSI